MEVLGRHLLVELFSCDEEVLDNPEKIEAFMMVAARVSGATIVESVFHRFQPHGISGVVVIAESHLAIHTWPEHGYAAVDFFTCGADIDYWRAHDFLKEAFAAGDSEVRELLRGGERDAAGKLGRRNNGLEDNGSENSKLKNSELKKMGREK
ncbi:MAG: S-adenosylmethionine decarboxylase proenzyme [Deltaproteobacteria bacterium]|nr:S-adenosylmethionine decarboxylase proenzyme [Candidatus Tharpella aukensis]